MTISFSGIGLPQASTVAAGVDSLYDFILWTSAVGFVVVIGGILYFSLKYRRRGEHHETPYIEGHTPTEIGVMVLLFVWGMVIFAWGYVGYHHMQSPPANAMEINVIGRQWMWEFQYPNGKKVLNELRVPKGVPVKLLLTSADVIHSFYVPSFRLKQDALPGMYTALWFQATLLGKQQVFCAEYCGTSHSAMKADLIVMEPQAYQDWLEGWGQTEEAASADPVAHGKLLYQAKGCVACHSLSGKSPVGPTFENLFGSDVELSDGKKVKADENYIRESIMDPQAKMVKGYTPLMPTFRGQMTDEEVNDMMAFIKSVSK